MCVCRSSPSRPLQSRIIAVSLLGAVGFPSAILLPRSRGECSELSAALKIAIEFGTPTEKIGLEPRRGGRGLKIAGEIGTRPRRLSWSQKVHSPCCARSLRGISCDCVDFFLVDVLLYVNRNRRLIRDGEHRTATSTFTQALNSVLISSTPGLCSLLQNLSFQLRAFSLQLHCSGAV